MLSSETIPFIACLVRRIGKGFAVDDRESRSVATDDQEGVVHRVRSLLLAVLARGHDQKLEPPWLPPWRLVQQERRSLFHRGPGDSLLIVAYFSFPTTFMFRASCLLVPLWCCCKSGLHRFPALCPPVAFMLLILFHFPFRTLSKKKNIVWIPLSPENINQLTFTSANYWNPESNSTYAQKSQFVKLEIQLNLFGNGDI